MNKHENAVRIWGLLCDRRPEETLTLHRHGHGGYAIGWHVSTLNSVRFLLDEIGAEIDHRWDVGGSGGRTLICVRAEVGELRIDVMYEHPVSAELPGWISEELIDKTGGEQAA